ncbi:MAG: adenosylmethionine--8-amino-7-oxononanoate transaminase [Gemmataceae bacterium]|nr:adenosylmethionine--8-amino-7-oxononanoate transaminase [Gemmataceae bacterium]
MRKVIIVGTDTDAGKTTFSIIFLNLFSAKYSYWKPLETGPSDTAKVRQYVPQARVFDPLRHYEEAVAPLLASRRSGRPLPTLVDIHQAAPVCENTLLIETFGGPLSPLTDSVLQIELIRAWRSPVILVGSSAIGAVGRALAALEALHGVPVVACVLLGPEDPFAVKQIQQHAQVPVFSLELPQVPFWDRQTLQEFSRIHKNVLRAIDQHIDDFYKNLDIGGKSIREIDSKYVWHPYTPLLEPLEQLPVVSAQGEFLNLVDGQRVIDAIASWWTILHGHCHPPLVQALRRAAATLDHTVFAGTTHPWAVELAERLVRSAPWGGVGRVFFSDNGSTAVEVALKMAVQFWHMQGQKRHKFICFDNSYHGDTFGAMSVGRDPVYFGMYEPLLFDVIQAPLQVEALTRAVERWHKDVAAVIVEPLVQGAGGMRMHPPEVLRSLWQVCKQEGLLFIVDEVMTACRTGRIWAFEHAGIIPDIVCTAKTLTGGMLPLAATLVSPTIVEPFCHMDRSRMFFHGHSYTANPLACAVAVANWRLLEQGHWRQEANRIEAFWATHLPRWQGHPRVKEVRWCGTIGVMELNVTGGYLCDKVPLWRQRALQMGVLLRPLGPVLYCLPPLCISEDSLHRVIEAFQACIDMI